MLIVASLIVGIVLLGICYETGRIVERVRRAKEMGRETTAFARSRAKALKRILVIGDSTSYGTGTTDGRYSLAGRLSADWPDYALDNRSENAMSLERLAQKMRSIEGPYERTFIHIGGVDTLTFTPLAQIRLHLAEALVLAHAFTTGPIYLVSVDNTGAKPAFHAPVSWLFSWRSRKVSRLCGEVCAAEGALHVPLWRKRGEDPLRVASRRCFARDDIHPNEEGYGLWYKMIKHAL